MKTKILTPFLFVALVGLVLSSGCVQQPIGGERDEHGCLNPAGYTWNETASACVREWELNENQKLAAKTAVDYVGYVKGTTIIGVAVARCPGCFLVEVEKGMDRIKVTLENWEVKFRSMTPDECESLGGRPVNIVGGESCANDEINMGEVTGFISPNICCVPSASGMTIDEAREIAQNSECTEKGNLTSEYMFNADTKTYWINLDIEKPGCSPACVVDIETKQAEINWRCMGAL